MNGVISSIQRLSSGDGPGMRTTAFFKGCPLRCKWCHNPETWTATSTLGWKEKKCIGCFSCVKECPVHAISLTGTGLQRDTARCLHCGRCHKTCPAGAITLYGKEIESNMLVKELCKDRYFFESSGGGVTLSGGEVLAQADFAIEIVEQLHSLGISVAIDTCGYGDIEKLIYLSDICDLILFDIKLLDPENHRRYTGSDNALILNNIRTLAAHLKERNRSMIWIRTPMIPGCTDDDKNIMEIGRFITNELGDTVERWDLLLFHNMCKEKYKELGMKWQMEGTELINKKEFGRIQQTAEKSGIEIEKIHILGLAVD